jgi:hypothetical protein
VYFPLARAPRYQRVKAPTKGELEQLAQLISQRVGRCLERHGLLEQDAENAWPDLDPAEDTFDGFFQAPILLFIIIGLIRQRPWLAPIGLIYAGAGTTNTFFTLCKNFWPTTHRLIWVTIWRSISHALLRL